MKEQTTIIISMRTSEYKNVVDENVKKFNCKDCGEEVSCGDIVMRHAKSNSHIKKKATQKIKFICNKCYVKLPKMGKLIRPNKEMIERLREEGMPLDEIEIRKMMHTIKHKMKG